MLISRSPVLERITIQLLTLVELIDSPRELELSTIDEKRQSKYLDPLSNACQGRDHRIGRAFFFILQAKKGVPEIGLTGTLWEELTWLVCYFALFSFPFVPHDLTVDRWDDGWRIFLNFCGHQKHFCEQKPADVFICFCLAKKPMDSSWCEISKKKKDFFP